MGFRFMAEEMVKMAAEEFAPGIPASREKKPLPSIKKPKLWELAVQSHQAEKAGPHFDLRLGDPSKGHAHSWAVRNWPKPGETRLAVQQPTHTIPYMDFKGQLPEGYGKGQVELAQRGKAEVLHSSPDHVRYNVYAGKNTEEFLLRRTGGDKWIVRNITPTRESTGLPSSKPKYKATTPEKVSPDNPDTVLQAKIDGAHVLYDFAHPNQQSRVFSYRPTERSTGIIEHTHRLPGFQRHRVPDSLRGTVLRGELYATDSSGKALPPAQVGGILNAGVLKSRQKQKTEGRVVPVAFDVVRFQGNDVSDRPYSERLEMLHQAVKAAPWLKLPRMAITPEAKARLMEDIRTGKEPSTEEGVVEWSLGSAAPPRKAKFQQERDVFVKNVFPERGKRQGLAGGFEFSYTKDGPIVGRAAGGMGHAMKKDMLENPSKYEGLRARISALRAPEQYAPRNASFKSFHLDQDIPEDVKTAAIAKAAERALFEAEDIPWYTTAAGATAGALLGQRLKRKKTLGQIGGAVLGTGVGLVGGKLLARRLEKKAMALELHKMASVDVYVDKSEGMDRGMFAERDFAPGETIEVAPVLVVPRSQIKKDHVLRNYVFRWDDTHVMVALGYASMFNHSYEPNARYDKDKPTRTLTFKAIKPISKGEEIFVNYNHEPDDKSPLWFDVKEKQTEKAAEDQKCLRRVLRLAGKNPDLKVMMGPPGKKQDTRHFWAVDSEGKVHDPTYNDYKGYSRGKPLDMRANAEFLSGLREKTAEDQSVSVGYASATVKPEGEKGVRVEKLWVDPEHRGKGEARKLIQKIKQDFADKDVWIRPRPFGDMETPLEELKKFYESEGFKTMDKLDNMVFPSMRRALKEMV